MTIWQFMSESPWLTFFLALIIAGVLKAPFRLWNRVLRSRNIRERGWPPPHLDADGDWKSEG